MKIARRSIALWLVATLILPTLLFVDSAVPRVEAASAPEVVDFIKGDPVYWQNQWAQHALYFRYDDRNGQDPTDDKDNLLLLKPASRNSGQFERSRQYTVVASDISINRGQCPSPSTEAGLDSFTAPGQGDPERSEPASRACFIYPSQFTHDVTVRGREAFYIYLPVTAPTGLTWTVIIRDTVSASEIARASFAGLATSGDEQITRSTISATIPVTDPSGVATIRKNSYLIVEIYAVNEDSAIPIIGDDLAAGTWTLHYNNDRVGDDADTGKARLILTSDNAIKTAIWTESEVPDAKYQTAFKKTPASAIVKKEEWRKNNVTTWFAAKSAFGLRSTLPLSDPDATNDFYGWRDALPGQFTQPRATIAYKNESLVLNGATFVPLVNDATRSQAGNGISTWRTSRAPLTGVLNITERPAGAYSVEVQAPIHRADKLIQSRVETKRHDFIITDSAITLKPFDDPATEILQDETASHLMEAGKTTTFVLELQNTGSSRDTIALTTTSLREDGATSWQPLIRGVKVVEGNRITLNPGERTLVTVTLLAPAGLANGATSLFLITARSGLDPTAKSELVLTSTVNNAADADKFEVGVIALNTTIYSRPGQEGNQTVYVWNRGTRTMNITANLGQVPDTAWSEARFKLANDRRDTSVTYQLAAGEIRPIEIGVTPGITLGDKASYKISVNASNAKAPTISTREITAIVAIKNSFHIEILRNRGEVPRLVERYSPIGSVQGRIGEIRDNVSGVWARVWVVNDGDSAQTFEATLNTDFDAGGFTGGQVFGQATFGTKNLDGSFVPGDQNTVVLSDVPPKRAAEFYAWVPVRDPVDDSSRCQEGLDCLTTTVGLSLKITSRTTGASDFATIGFAANNVDSSTGLRAAEVYIEPVARINDAQRGLPYNDKHLVDLSSRGDYLAGKNVLVKNTDLGGTVTYRVRVTHGGSWAAYETPEGNRIASPGKLTLDNVYRDLGWIAEMRFADGVNHPWVTSLTLDNAKANNVGVPANANGVRPTRQGWIDREVEVRVKTPTGETQARLVSGDRALVNLKLEIPSPSGDNWPGDKELFQFETRVAARPDLKIEPCNSLGCGPTHNELFVHAGKTGHWILNLSNLGGKEGVFTIESRIANSVGGTWGAPQPSRQVFNLTAHENRTLALSVRAPAGAQPGDTAEVNVTGKFLKVAGDLNTQVEKSIRLLAEVKERGQVEVTVDRNVSEIQPLERVSFTIQVKNTGATKKNFDLSTTLLPNWSRTVSPTTVSLQAGEIGAAALLVQAPGDIVRGREYELVFNVRDRDDDANFVSEVFRFVTTGGEARPRLVTDRQEVIVNRTEARKVEVGIQNIGNVGGLFGLEVSINTLSNEQPWKAWVVNELGENLTDTNGDGVIDIFVKPKERRNINVTIQAPYRVAEGTVKTVTLRALAPDLRSSVDTNLRGVIHDYGVEIQFPAGRNTIDIVPGFSGSIPVRIRNIGNANDTANLSLDVNRNLGWKYQFSQERIFLTPGSWGEVQLIVSSPQRPLPTPRQFLMVVYAGSVGGAPVNYTKLVNLPVFINVLDYRVADVDGDGQREIAVDLDKNRDNGFEEYREVYEEGLRSQAIDKLKGRFDKRTKILVDVEDAAKTFDGIADYYWDPDDSTQTPIADVLDFDRDGTLDYFIDLDGDGRVDVLYNTVSKQYMNVLGRDFSGNGGRQYLIDEDGDGIYDKFADPNANLVTRVSLEPGERYGIDTTNDGNANRYYDPRTGSVTVKPLEDFGDFAQRYWYFFVGFVLVSVLFLVVVARRRRT